MPEPRADMFPEHTDGEVAIPEAVPAPSVPAPEIDPVPAPVAAPRVSTPTPAPSAGIPYAKYHEVLQEKKQLEAKLKELEGQSVPFDNSGLETPADVEALQTTVNTLTERLDKYERQDAMNEVLTSFPQLTDKIEEFDSFLEAPENKILPLTTAAKIFLVDNNLLTQAKLSPKGLEKPSGGGTRTPPKTGMSIEDSERLRKNDPRKWVDMARKGQLPDDSLM